MNEKKPLCEVIGPLPGMDLITPIMVRNAEERGDLLAIARQRADFYHGSAAVAQGRLVNMLRFGLTLVISSALAVAVSGQLQGLLTQPMGSLPGAESSELMRDLGRILPALDVGQK